jgi:hypothetical protein
MPYILTWFGNQWLTCLEQSFVNICVDLICLQTCYPRKYLGLCPQAKLCRGSFVERYVRFHEGSPSPFECSPYLWPSRHRNGQTTPMVGGVQQGRIPEHDPIASRKRLNALYLLGFVLRLILMRFEPVMTWEIWHYVKTAWFSRVFELKREQVNVTNMLGSYGVQDRNLSFSSTPCWPHLAKIRANYPDCHEHMLAKTWASVAAI